MGEFIILRNYPVQSAFTLEKTDSCYRPTVNIYGKIAFSNFLVKYKNVQQLFLILSKM